MILLHLNGPPAVGKSTVAELVCASRSGSLLLDIDSIRMSLPGWREDPETMRRARSIAYETASQYLRSGNDVVVPQLDARTETLLLLQRLAIDAGATFVEVLLVADRDELVRRFESRIGEHPADAVIDAATLIDEYLVGLDRVRAAWPTAIVIESTTPTETAARVLAALPAG